MIESKKGREAQTGVKGSVLKVTKPRFSQRSRIGIIACILKNSNERSGTSRLICRRNLSSSQFNLCKDYLVEAGLLRVTTSEDEVQIFKTTKKGKEFLKDYQEIRSLIEKKICSGRAHEHIDPTNSTSI